MRGRAIYRTLYYLPYITSVIAAAVIFNWLMNPTYGFFNSLLELVGIGPQKWLNEPRGPFELLPNRAPSGWPAGPSPALVGAPPSTTLAFIGLHTRILLSRASPRSSH